MILPKPFRAAQIEEVLRLALQAPGWPSSPADTAVLLLATDQQVIGMLCAMVEVS